MHMLVLYAYYYYLSVYGGGGKSIMEVTQM